jgi:hypothetical protein
MLSSPFTGSGFEFAGSYGPLLATEPAADSIARRAERAGGSLERWSTLWPKRRTAPVGRVEPLAASLPVALQPV